MSAPIGESEHRQHDQQAPDEGADRSGDWLGEDRTALATNRILDAAAELFVRNGVGATTMAQIARASGCSRATLYNHFADRRQLEVAFVHREALALSAQVASRTSDIEDPRHRIREAFMLTLESVRQDHRLASWFSAMDSARATRITKDSEVLDAIALAFAGSLAEGLAPDELRRRSRWVLRIIVSMLAMPEATPAEEELLVEQFVAPVLLAAGPAPGPPRNQRPPRRGDATVIGPDPDGGPA